MKHFYGTAWTVTMDVRKHAAWSSQRLARQLSQAEREDLEAMLSMRGVKEVPEYPDEPISGPRGPRGGGGRKRARGCPPDKVTRQKTHTGEHMEAEVSLMANGDETTSDSIALPKFN